MTDVDVFKTGFIEGPAQDFSRTAHHPLRAVSATSMGAGGVRLEFHEEFYRKQVRVVLRPATAVHTVRSLLTQLALGYLQDVDIHDLKHIQRSIAMLIDAKQRLG